MKKVTAFIGTQTKKATFRAVQEFEKSLKQYGNFNFEYAFISDYHLEFCRGCKVCFEKGEEYCPAKDDRDKLLDKIERSDGVVFATPTYLFQVTARMKNLLDRMGFIGHRPRFFKKTFTAIVTQGLPMGSDTLKYLTFTAKTLGFQVSKGCCLTTLDPMTEDQQKKLIRETKKAAKRFSQEMNRPLPPPSLMFLVVFRMVRNQIKARGPVCRDYHYYKKKGWFTSDYFYPTSLGLLKKMLGNLTDVVSQKFIKW